MFYLDKCKVKDKQYTVVDNSVSHKTIIQQYLLYIKVEQMSKKTVYNENQFSQSQKFQMSKEECCNVHCSWGQRQRCQYELTWRNTEMHIIICLEMS